MEDRTEDALVGEVMPQDPVSYRYFKTLRGLTDYIETFGITHGSFAYGQVPEVGLCYVLEFPSRVQD